jgi:uncharacterized protein YkwD
MRFLLILAMAFAFGCGDEKNEEQTCGVHKCPTPSPAPSPAPSPKPEPTPAPVPQPVPSPNPQPTPSPSPSPAPTPNPGPSQCEAGAVECQAAQVIFQENNKLRQSAGVPALKYNDKLAYVAWDWSKKQAAAGKISHDGFNEARLKVLADRFPGSKDSITGENVAYFMGGTDVKDGNAVGKKFYSQWLGSPGHKENMVRKTFTELGNGVYITGNKAYGTQLFGQGAKLVGVCQSIIIHAPDNNSEEDEGASSTHCEEL